MLWSLGKMGMKWTQLPKDIANQILSRLSGMAPELSPQQSSKVLWALGATGAPLAGRSSFDSEFTEFVEICLSNIGKIKKSKIGLSALYLD